MILLHFSLFFAPQKVICLSLRRYAPPPSSEGAYTDSFCIAGILFCNLSSHFWLPLTRKLSVGLKERLFFLYKPIYVFTNTVKVFINLVVWYSNNGQIEFFKLFCADFVFYHIGFIIML